jgi:hypothetical protein
LTPDEIEYPGELALPPGACQMAAAERDKPNNRAAS